MSDNYRSLKRRTVLSAAGAGILGNVLSGSGAAATHSDVSTDSDEPIADSLGEPIDGYLVATHVETGDEYVFDSSGEIDTQNLPTGEYRLDHHQQTPESVVVDTEYVTVDDTIRTASDETTLEVAVDDDRGIDAEGSLSVWVSATIGTDKNVSGAANATITFEITDDENNVVLEDQTTTDEHGFGFVEFDLNLEGGAYSLTVEWVDEELTSFHSFETGSFVDVGRLSGPVGPNEEVRVPVSRTLETDPNPGTTEVELERPDGSTETLSVDINDGGVGIAEFVPDETGSHSVDPIDGWGTTITVRNWRFYTEDWRLRNQLVDEPIVHGGFILDDAAKPVGNESIEVELQERFGDDVYDSTETSTDAYGRFTVEFDPLSEADSYSVVVQTTDGEEIGSERLRLNEIEKEREPELSVSLDEFSARPNETVTATIDLTDASEEPVAGDVTVIERMGFNGPILAIDSVSTNQRGTAEYETAAPELFIESERFYVEAVAAVDGETVDDNSSLTVESVDIDFSWSDAEAGSSVEREVTITDHATGEPLSGEDTGMVFSRGHIARGGAIAADNGTTDGDGTVEFEFDVPNDARQQVRFDDLYRPYRPISSTRTSFIRPFSSSVDIPNEASPGESFEMEYTVDDHDADTVGMVFVDIGDEAHVEIIGPNESVSVDVPARMAGDTVRTETVIMDTDAHLVIEFDSVSIIDEDTHESGVDQDVFDAVDQDGDGDVTLEELVEANLERIGDPNNEVNGVEVTLEELVELNIWRLTA